MKGKWKGEYIYEVEYPEMENRTVSFEVDMTITDGIINGICIDDETKNLFKEPANINGFIEGDLISFIKTYPFFYFINDHGIVEVDTSIPPHSVNYTGTYNNSNNSFSGTWEITVDSQTFGEYMIDNVLTGTWKMNKLK